MTDNDIIKALERCYSGCDKDCPWYSDDDFCMFKMQQQAADLIIRQKAEIERLKDHNKQLRYDRKQITSEAIKEFAERLRALFINDFRFYRKTEDIVEKDLKRIDNLVKEMTEVKE